MVLIVKIVKFKQKQQKICCIKKVQNKNDKKMTNVLF